MTIASELTALQQDIVNARNAVTAKGGTVTSGGGSSQLATDIATIPTGGEAKTVPISTNSNIDIDFSVCELYEGITGDGALSANRVIPTGISIPPTGYHYNIEFKFRKTELIPNKDENFISCTGNSYTGFRVGITRTGYIFCRGWNRTNLQSPSPVSLNEDHIVKLQYNNGTVSMYIDDVFQASNSVSETMEGGELYIGSFISDDASAIYSTYLGTLYYIKMTDPAHNDKVILDWERTVDKDGSPLIFINGGATTKILDLPNHTLYGATGGYIDGANPLKVTISTKWGATAEDFFNTSLSATPTLHDVVIPAGEANRSLNEVFKYSTIRSFTATGTYMNSSYGPYRYALANNPYLESVDIRAGTSWTSSNTGWQYFAFNCTGLKHVSVAGLVASSSGSFSYMFQNCTALEDVTWHFNPSQPYVSITNQFSSTFNGDTSLTKVDFSELRYSSGNSVNPFNYTFRDCLASFDEDINHFRFPNLTYIGVNSGTSNYGFFRYAFNTLVSTYYGKCHLIYPELKYIYNNNTTVSNGHFAYNNALGKIYLPKFVADGTTGQYIFNSSSYLTEIHCGIENEATVTALAGYTSKFGATNATIYFDMVNHITVNDTVYDRSGAEYDYDNSYYSWKNGTDVIYTTNAIDPAVGDTVYTRSGTTYTSAGTIQAIA